MADVIRELREHEGGLFMPARELLDPQRAEVKHAVAQFVTSLVDRGVMEQTGEVIVALDDSLRVVSDYSFKTGE